MSEVLTDARVGTLPDIDISETAATDGIPFDDDGTARRMSIQGMGVRVVDASAANQTFALGDANTLQTIAATSRTFTIPSGVFHEGACIGVASTGAGEITLDPAAGVTLNSIIAQGSTASRTVLAGGTALLILVDSATDNWNLVGNIS